MSTPIPDNIAHALSNIQGTMLTKEAVKTFALIWQELLVAKRLDMEIRAAFERFALEMEALDKAQQRDEKLLNREVELHYALLEKCIDKGLAELVLHLQTKWLDRPGFVRQLIDYHHQVGLGTITPIINNGSRGDIIDVTPVIIK